MMVGVAGVWQECAMFLAWGTASRPVAAAITAAVFFCLMLQLGRRS
jgi:hypothetical protein